MNLFEKALRQLEKIAKIINLDKNILEILKQPQEFWR